MNLCKRTTCILSIIFYDENGFLNLTDSMHFSEISFIGFLIVIVFGCVH